MIINPVNEKPLRHVLAQEPERSNVPDISTPQQWEKKRATLRAKLLELLGTPSQNVVPEARYRVLGEERHDGYQQFKIAYEVEPGEEVRAYLLVPHRPHGAAVLCLHGTSVEAKDTQIGAGAKPRRDWARFLAGHGFITLAPDHLCSGERLPAGVKPYDTTPFYARHPHWSAAGKAAWDGSRALDILQTVEGVDAARLGCIGHSLGGHGTMWVAAFDERVRASVYSCGLSSWQENPRRYEWSREAWYIYIPRLRAIFQKQEKTGGLLPVEMYEFAALVAPRAMLNISGMTDLTYGNNETLPEIGLQLNALWETLGAPAGFAQLLFGAGHEISPYSRLAALGWLQHWLEAPEDV